MATISEEFNNHSQMYRQFRPTYPAELFKWISKITQRNNLALDCGTGNGQAAYHLAQYFKHIIGIDSNENQLKEAMPHPHIAYKIMPAECIQLKNSSVDLIVAASAVHWFDLNIFYEECHRLLTPSGNIVVWTYSWPQTKNINVNRSLNDIKTLLDPYWSRESLLHLNHYQNLAFPFRSIPTPIFELKVEWTTKDLLNFLLTWVSVRHYIKYIDKSLLTYMEEILSSSFSTHKSIHFHFPLAIKAGRLF